MEITVNQKNYHLQETCSVEHMLSVVLQTEAKGIAVAINQSIISKSSWPNHIVNDGDSVMLIKATQGG
ncbi:sulfur carrier protein ThiS [Pedobacter metabolipauper]|uniref:Sulfur carrier protein n=1 Tax=Pedobacter metabolipauper TaxID=425513 RepID=A0A4R6T010_9SPHI|nr:sulfur carrier protein ThiS [Pedobacter metabolipauper]TDQ11339.1 sulfur carrier protein [Pedobacter metabolipauper]